MFSLFPQVKLIQDAWILATLPDGGGGRILGPLPTSTPQQQQQRAARQDRQDSSASMVNTRSSSLARYGADGGVHSSGGGGGGVGVGRDGPTLLIGDDGGGDPSSRPTSPPPHGRVSSSLAAVGAGLASLIPQQPNSALAGRAAENSSYPFANSAPTTREVLGAAMSAEPQPPRADSTGGVVSEKQQPRRQVASSDLPSTGGGTASTSSPPARLTPGPARPPPAARHDFTHLEPPAQRRMAGLLRMHVTDSVRAHIEAGHLDFINE